MLLAWTWHILFEIRGLRFVADRHSRHKIQVKTIIQPSYLQQETKPIIYIIINFPNPKPPVPQLLNPKVQIYLSGMRGIGEDGHWRTKNKWLYKGRIRGCTKGNPNRIRHRVGRQFKAGKSTFCWPTISERNLLDNQRLASSRGVLGQNRS